MEFSKILLLYKRSAYQIYFLEKWHKDFSRENPISRQQIQRFKKAHDAHYRSLFFIENILRRYKIPYKKYARGHKVNYEDYGMVITVGGDGTFLEAARNLREQFILGVNSDPHQSIGRFCTATAETFEKMITKIRDGNFDAKLFPRIKLRLNYKLQERTVNVLNDILICHENPAAMSRYQMEINDIDEEQRSSGVWIATAAGASGAIKSAGGRRMSPLRQEIQYQPRELYYGRNNHYRLTGGMLKLKTPMRVVSLMRNGSIFVDGAHLRFLFPFGNIVKIFHSPDPIKIIGLR